ncbi:MAG: hypothetical protein LBD82_07810 [Deltaproteobacteria bacterium]|jgi:hypothetical protein|nr:hypothetical protein [Deltaproteobacteria bacterium]
MTILKMDEQEIKQRALWGLLCLAGILLTACSPSSGKVSAAYEPLPHAVMADPPRGSLMLEANTKAGDALGGILLPRIGSTAGSILTTSLVSLENLDKSSAFGRVSAQQIGSRLNQHGFKVLEPRLSASLRFEKDGGEFMLTRESLRLLADSHDAHAVLVGTYSEARDKIFVSARVVRLMDNALLAAYEYYLPKSGDVPSLLGEETHTDGYAGDNALWLKYARREPAFTRRGQAAQP